MPRSCATRGCTSPGFTFNSGRRLVLVRLAPKFYSVLTTHPRSTRTTTLSLLPLFSAPSVLERHFTRDLQASARRVCTRVNSREGDFSTGTTQRMSLNRKLMQNRSLGIQFPIISCFCHFLTQLPSDVSSVTGK
jgi:hypothetical protein